MPSITFGGLATGLDTNALIDGLMAVERIQVDRLMQKQQLLRSAKDSVSSFSSKLGELKTAAEALMNPTKFASFTATSSNSSAVGATIVGVPEPSSYDIEVINLAREQRTYADGQASNTAALGMTGTLGLTVGADANIDVTIDSTDSLADIATKINNSGARTKATVIYDGTNYRLQVRGTDTGAANAITFNETGFSLGLSTPANTVQAATDATIKVDTLTITRDKNTVSGIIPGVTLNLNETTTGPLTVKVESDGDALREKIDTFVKAYNNVVSAAHLASGFGETKAANSELAGDSTFRTSLDRIARIVGSPVAGTSGIYQTLTSVGLKSTKEGQLELDAVKLSEALEADPDAVARLFVDDPATGATGAMEDMAAAIEALIGDTTSVVTSRASSLDKRANDIDDEVDRVELRLTAMEDNLRKQFTQLELLVNGINAQGNALAGIQNLSYNKSK